MMLVGFTESYTTYYGFGVEAFYLFSGLIITVLTYLFVQMVTGVLAVWAGMVLAKRLSAGK